MFSSVGWELLENANEATCVRSPSGKELRIVKRNEFDHARATMSVIVQDKEGRLHVYCKVSCWKILNYLQFLISSSFPHYLSTLSSLKILRIRNGSCKW